MTREEVIAAMKKCAQELGHAPSFTELHKQENVSKRSIRKYFCTYTQALRASGLERHGGGHVLSPKSLFLDWAGVARKLGKPPRITEYELHGKYSQRPMLRVFGKWKHVAPGFLEYGRREGMEGEWGDVLDLVGAYLASPGEAKKTMGLTMGTPTKPRILIDEPIYGPPMVLGPLTYCPTNEAGVAVLFGAMAKDLGFAITRVQSDFPDCEAMREVEKERWQRVRIEFEYESKNFLAHMHPADKCDLIICWSHNWQECPLEVVELKSAVTRIG